MLRENWRFVQRVEKTADCAVIVLAFCSAYFLRNQLPFFTEAFGLEAFEQNRELAPLASYLPLLVVALVSSLSVLSLIGAYGSMRLASLGRLLWLSSTSSLVTLLVMSSLLYLIKSDVSRIFILLFSLSSTLFLFFERVAVLRLLRYWRRRGRNFRNLLFYGYGLQADLLAKEISRHPELGVGIKGVIVLDPSKTGERKKGLSESELLEKEKRDPSIFTTLPHSLSHLPVFLTLESTLQGLHDLAIDEVLFTDVGDSLAEVKEVIALCAAQGVKTTIAADILSLGLAQSSLSYFAGVPLIHYQTPPGDKWQLGVKRCLDVVIAFFAIILLAPLFLIVAIAIYLDDGAPILFKQKRVGLNGRIFTLYKFRSMKTNSTWTTEELLLLNEMEGPVFKIRSDPRRTRVGIWLRRFSLDEFPQLWNVFRADMSLVGPRPPMPSEVEHYEITDRRRLSMRPGLTCTWQVTGRNSIKNFDSWVRLDLDYIDNWSLSRDLALLLKTIPAVIFGHGAH